MWISRSSCFRMINFFIIGVDEQLEFRTYTWIHLIQEINNIFFLTVHMFRYDVATFLSHKSVESGDPVICTHSLPLHANHYLRKHYVPFLPPSIYLLLSFSHFSYLSFYHKNEHVIIKPISSWMATSTFSIFRKTL